ncbi:hypothetical protein CC80DRAFT_554924 [Byssothecium circinans]|uniref:Uncharacterized protein n=1 Tax=Byssothecium circinans TaxID=147558 RepID=A0A6A5TC46_9PLEO|nr:hypothetical protein CC80DRAFT_554924 [Byssothecium circinans]
MSTTGHSVCSATVQQLPECMLSPPSITSTFTCSRESPSNNPELPDPQKSTQSDTVLSPSTEQSLKPPPGEQPLPWADGKDIGKASSIGLKRD